MGARARVAANDDRLVGSSVRFRVEPRDVPAVKAARRLHLTEAQFSGFLPRLREQGFPAPDAVTGHFDLKAIDAWMDRRSGLANPHAADDAGDFRSRLDALRAKARRL